MLHRIRQYIRPSFWPLNLAGWAVVAVVIYCRQLLHLSWEPSALFTIYQTSLSLILSLGMRQVYRQIANRHSFTVGSATGIVAASIIATLIQASTALALAWQLGWKNPAWTLHEEWLLRLIFFGLIYLVWSLLYFWLKSGDETKEARAETERMELQMLRAQLDPHFLFNALNGVATMISAKPQDAVKMTREIARYLRYSLDHREETVISLADELEAVTDYLRIEQARFTDQLVVDISATPEAEKSEVPCFLLQPLVENAVKHSFRQSDPPWRLSIRAETKDNDLYLQIRNSGTLDNAGREGVGLSNLRRRLAIHYPLRHRLRLSQEGAEVVAELILIGPSCSR